MTFIAVPLVFIQDPSPIINASHVFVTGLPGALDYAMLAAVKEGRMHSMTEKKINNSMNVWVRAPGLFATAVFGYVHGCKLIAEPDSGYTQLQFVCLMFNLIIYYWNAFYFMERVVGNFHVKNALNSAARKQNSH
mmetsp:Transcript_29055/g.62703  ORF Transcript_29055/g.62703 Transcript_29055/m.62703 type:complete len:135 (+) Transcript_29055:261-665(+)